MTSNTRLLQAALLANATFSTITGAFMLFGSEEVAALLGSLPVWLITAIGLSLFFFAAAVALVAHRPQPPRALFISVLDIGWVVSTVPLVFVPDLLTEFGVAAVLTVAGFVGLFATLQMLGIQRMLLDDEPGRGRYRLCIRVKTDAPADAMWEIIRDLENISRFSTDLATSALREAATPGPGVVRECSNTAGDQWAEKCVELDDEERSLEVQFLSDEPDFPYPVDAMFGGWKIDEDGDGSVVDVWFSLTPSVPFGWALVTLFGAKISSDFPQVISRMAATANGEPLPETPPRLRPAFC